MLRIKFRRQIKKGIKKAGSKWREGKTLKIESMLEIMTDSKEDSWNLKFKLKKKYKTRK